MIYFKTRDAARDFAARSGHRFIDRGADVEKRWAVQLLLAE